jgi:hypothetical protein
MADKFNIEKEYADGTGEVPVNESEMQEQSIEFDAAQVKKMQEFKANEDFEGLGKYVANLI